MTIFFLSSNKSEEIVTENKLRRRKKYNNVLYAWVVNQTTHYIIDLMGKSTETLTNSYTPPESSIQRKKDKKNIAFVNHCRIIDTDRPKTFQVRLILSRFYLTITTTTPYRYGYSQNSVSQSIMVESSRQKKNNNQTKYFFL